MDYNLKKKISLLLKIKKKLNIFLKMNILTQTTENEQLSAFASFLCVTSPNGDVTCIPNIVLYRALYCLNIIITGKKPQKTNYGSFLFS